MSEKISLTPELKAQLEAYGVNIKALIASTVRSPRNEKEKPINCDLSKQSGETEYHCKCCNTITTKYFDLIKREDCEGYAVKTVDVPTNKVTIKQVYNVCKCANCDDEALDKEPNHQLIKMIHNLRRNL